MNCAGPKRGSVTVSDNLPTPYEKAREAHRMRLEGLSWIEVADAVGYANRQVAQTEVRAMLQRAALELSVEEKLERLSLEVERLDSLQSAVWPQAMNGDTKAVDSVVRIINTRAKLLGLEMLHEQKGSTTNTTVIITGTPEERAQMIKKFVQGTEDGDG